MPEKRLAKARETLPAGFQFGDGAKTSPLPEALSGLRFHRDAFSLVMGAPMRYPRILCGWNTIEPE